MSELHTDTNIAQMVRSTLHTATQPDNRRLAQLMPQIPAQRPSRATALTWQRQLASLCVLALLLLGGVGLWQFEARPGMMGVAATATQTTEPTHTVVLTETAVAPTATAVAADTAAPQPLFFDTPPPPTPVTGIVQTTN